MGDSTDDIILSFLRQAGVDLDGLSARDSFGGSVSMSTDGSRVAIGAPDSDGPSGVNNGRVQVYKY